MREVFSFFGSEAWDMVTNIHTAPTREIGGKLVPVIEIDGAEVLVISYQCQFDYGVQLEVSGLINTVE